MPAALGPDRTDRPDLVAWEDLPVRALAEVLRLWPEPDLGYDNPAGNANNENNENTPDTAGAGADPVLLLATVQSRAAWDELRFGRQLTQTWDRVDPAREGAYRWMSGRLTARTGVNDCCPAPLWLWARAGANTLIDDITWDPSDSVLLTVAVPASRVVLSSHEGWHYVLNGEWCPPPTRDSAAARPVLRPDPFEGSPAQVQRRVHTSWNWILVPGLWPTSGPVQAVTGFMRAEEIVSANRFHLP